MSTEHITLIDPRTGNRLVCLAEQVEELRALGWRRAHEVGDSA